MMENNCKYFILIDVIIVLTALEWALSKWNVPNLSTYKQIETIILLFLMVSLPFAKQKYKSSRRVNTMPKRVVRIGKIIIYCFCIIAIVYFLRWLILIPIINVTVQKTAYIVLDVLFLFFSLLIILLQLYYWRKSIK